MLQSGGVAGLMGNFLLRLIAVMGALGHLRPKLP